jgi:diaminopimelate decarboxylase
MISAEIAKQIAEKFDTPVYAYEQKKLCTQLQNLVETITWRPLKILYAIKANSSLQVVRTLLSQKLPENVVLGIDAVSPGEIMLAISRAKISPMDILFTGNNSRDDEVDYAMDCSVLPNIDSLERLEWFCRRYPSDEVCVRKNPGDDVGAGHHDHCITCGSKSKFGIWYTEAENALHIAKDYGVKIVLLHQHIGSQILDPEKFMVAMEAMYRTAPIFPDLQGLDYGGGFGIPYKPGEKQLDMDWLGPAMSYRHAKFCEAYGRKLEMIIEPGRYLVGEAGTLYARVTCVKENPDGTIFIGVDAGFNVLIRPMAYGSYHEVVNCSNPDEPPRPVYVVGNICETGDKFTPEPRMIPMPKKGDLLAIKNAGAYGFSMSSNYNLRPRPPEIMVTDDGFFEARPRESVEELVARA